MCGCKGKCGCNITSTTKGEKGDANSSSNLGYKVYVAILTQTGVSAPIASVLQNTLGGTPTFSYESTGDYKIILNGKLTASKRTVNFFISRYTDGANGKVLEADTTVEKDDEVEFLTYNSLDVLVNEWVKRIEIKVYS